MKKIYFILVFVLATIQVYSQWKFAPGYIIDNEGEKTNCLLVNTGVQYKGEDYIYKINKTDNPTEVDIKTISEFGVNDALRFVRSEIVLDVSDNKIETLSDTLNHQEWGDGHAFLCELVGSEIASLYYYYFEGQEYYFYKTKENKIKNLIYKKYQLDSPHQVETQFLYDTRFRDQLEFYFPCSINSTSVSYKKNNLKKYFETYIKEQNADYKSYKKETVGQLQFMAAAMLNSSSFYMKKDATLGTHFGENNTFAYGAEINYLFKFNRNLLGLFAEASYTQFKADYQDPANPQTSGIDYHVIEMPVGVLLNFNVVNDFKIYTKAGLVSNFVMDKSSIFLNDESNTYELKSSTNMLFAAGIKYKKIGAEFRYYTTRNITPHIYNKGSEFEQMAFRVSYTFFNIKGKE